MKRGKKTKKRVTDMLTFVAMITEQNVLELVKRNVPIKLFVRT